MNKANKKKEMRVKRHQRARFYLNGTSERPRLAVFRSLNHIYAQIIDDDKGITLVSASSVEKAAREKNVKGGNKEGARLIGTMIAERAKEKGITKVVFDKGGFKYHGRVKELADGARAGGLQF
ncbi:MAG: LSU ribosomal protein L18p (L5e) [Candidatus Ozemobacter sibiricus]|jgi:large subunit ribosomal protein L18|uniref:Large ribosomal subunit protein uL18 n=1 Tax=Candidatus Ozemobacter sibiricus TaxID=2268124 RepID=A0A367ZK37_9BACT|nr:MAG: LSU ribosomal protein L18p (L5e) [Candidatus Ozemobacter sibiricus]